MSSALPPLIQEYRAKADQLIDEQKKVKTSTKDMVDDTDKQTSRLSGIFGGAAKAAAGIALGVAAAGAAAITAIVKVGLQEAADASALNAQLNAGIVSTGNAANVTVEGMNALATSIQNMSGQTDDSIAGAQSLLLTFTNIKNVGADKIFDQATLAAANMAARLGGDAASQATVLGKALNDPIQGITALSKKGIQFTEDQKAMITSMTEAGDVMGAQKIILAELETQFGGSAEAAGKSLPGSLNRAKRAFEDLSQAVVEKFLPIVTPAISFLVDKLQELAPIAENVAGRIADAISGGGAGIADLFSNIGQTIQNFISGGGLLAAFNTGAVLREKLFNGIMQALPGILDAIVAFVPQLLSFITGTLVPQFVEQFSTLVDFAVDIVRTLVPKLVEALVSAIPILLDSIVTVVPQLIESLVGALANAIPVLIDGALTAFLSIVTGLLKVLPKVIEALVGLIPKVINSLVSMIPTLIDTALKFFNGILTALVTAIPIILTALVKAIPTIISALVGAIPALIDGALKLFLGIIEGLGKAIPQVIVALVEAIPQLILALVGALPDLIDGAIQLFLGIITGLVTAIPAIIKAVVDAVPQIVQALIDAAPLLLQAGVKLIEALIGGLQSAAKGINDVMLQIIGGAINGVIDLINGAISGINNLTKGISDATGGSINISFAKLPKLSFDTGGTIPGPNGAPIPITAHGGEEMLSNDMIAGRTPIPTRVVEAVNKQQQSAGTAPATAARERGGTRVKIIAQSNASAARIAAEVGWELRREG